MQAIHQSQSTWQRSYKASFLLPPWYICNQNSIKSTRPGAIHVERDLVTWRASVSLPVWVSFWSLSTWISKYVRQQIATTVAATQLTKRSTSLDAASRVSGDRDNQHCVIATCNGDGIASQVMLAERWWCQKRQCQNITAEHMTLFG